MPGLRISFGGAHPARIERVDTLSWGDFAQALSVAKETEDKASPGWYIAAEFSPAYRNSENFVARYALTFDYDMITPNDFRVIVEAYTKYEHLRYTTYSHTEEKPRWRFVFPLSRPVAFDEFQAVSRKVADWAGIELAARESHVPAQFMFMPSHKPEMDYTYEVNSGEVIDPDTILATYLNWTDRTEWPTRKQHDTLSGADVAADPTLKPGIVGDFCRAYTISAAIDKFKLPYERVR